MIFIVSEAWRTTYPGAAAGILAMRNVSNPARHPALERRKLDLEQELQNRYAGQDRTALEALPVMQAYETYYRRFKKTYHVLLQLDSVALKGKSLPSVAALVEAMFMAELKNGLLTAGHDLDVVQPPVHLEVARGNERYTLINEKEAMLKPGDMYMADGQGIISSVLYGPDRRTQIAWQTQRAVFAVYAAPGIGKEAVEGHLKDIVENVRIVSAEAEVETLEVY